MSKNRTRKNRKLKTRRKTRGGGVRECVGGVCGWVRKKLFGTEYTINNNNTRETSTNAAGAGTLVAISEKTMTPILPKIVSRTREEREWNEMTDGFRRQREETEDLRRRAVANAQNRVTRRAQENQERRRFIEEDNRIKAYIAAKENNKKLQAIVIERDDDTALSQEEKNIFNTEYRQKKSVSILNQGRYIQYLIERLNENPRDDDLRSFGAMIGSFETSYKEGDTKSEMLSTSENYSDYIRKRYNQTNYMPGRKYPSPWKILEKEVTFPQGLRIIAIRRDGGRHIYIGASSNQATPYSFIQTYRASGTGPLPEKTNYTIVYPDGRFKLLKQREGVTTLSLSEGRWK